MSVRKTKIRTIANHSLRASCPIVLGVALLLLLSCQKNKIVVPTMTKSSAQWETQADSISESNRKEAPAAYHPRQQEYPSRLEIGADYTYVNFTPFGNPSFRGNLGGAQGIYEYRPRNHFYGAAKLSWKQGDTHGGAGKRSLLYIDAQERVGYTFGFHYMDSMLTLFSGFGYRYIAQKLSSTTGSSLRFRYNEFYVPVGLLTNHTVSSWFAFGVGLTWMPQVFPTVKIIPLRGAYWSLRDTLNNFFVEVPLDFNLNKSGRFHLIINPFYEHWKDGHSTAKTSSGIPLGIPSNTYNFWGVNVNFGYCF